MMAEKTFASWNVNGIRAVAGKGFADIFAAFNADIFCLQETKVQPGQFEIALPGYTQYWNYAERKGYSGTAVFAKEAPLSVKYGIGIREFDDEGRTITLEYEDFFFITVYTPNAKEGLARIDYRVQWEDAFRVYLKALDAVKPVICCGDLNVAHNEIDLKNPKANRGNAGFSDEERGKFRELLAAGFTDTFRHFYPEVRDAYSWWSYRFNARANNAGWRIDYFLVSERLKDKLKDAKIHADIAGSDHCPVTVTIDF
jgi:exodeoxyribonuclease III